MQTVVLQHCSLSRKHCEGCCCTVQIYKTINYYCGVWSPVARDVLLCRCHEAYTVLVLGNGCSLVVIRGINNSTVVSDAPRHCLSLGSTGVLLPGAVGRGGFSYCYSKLLGVHVQWLTTTYF